jgi:hypothetical protein
MNRASLALIYIIPPSIFSAMVFPNVSRIERTAMAGRYRMLLWLSRGLDIRTTGPPRHTVFADRRRPDVASLARYDDASHRPNLRNAPVIPGAG